NAAGSEPGLTEEKEANVRTLAVSSAQQGLWIAQKMSPDFSNNPAMLWEIIGHLDLDLLDAAIIQVFCEAEATAVNFVERDGGLVQVVGTTDRMRPFRLDVSGEPDPQAATYARLAEMLGEPFDLSHDLLFR